MTKANQFYWDGVDHEDLHCVCGTPHPEVTSELVRTCTQCGAIADLINDEHWVVRQATTK
jgi:hypothetical protein